MIGDDPPYPKDIQRPRTRGDCVDGPRPCPFVSCRYHLALDVNPQSGSLQHNFADLELDQMPETCSLDVSSRGVHTLEDVGFLLNLTRERVRQLEEKALRHMPKWALEMFLTP
ncbi:MAG TPA: sigma factor-like helix-turn-helix DNA-binding protein [Polyangiales bacterium]|nr:sigma factor-like helix-turn-helix DNA-binding protein [Polyangiales bacterium]